MIQKVLSLKLLLQSCVQLGQDRAAAQRRAAPRCCAQVSLATSTPTSRACRALHDATLLH
eukprot:4536953-Pleurochrysis_carterae.AAC.2